MFESHVRYIAVFSIEEELATKSFCMMLILNAVIRSLIMFMYEFLPSKRPVVFCSVILYQHVDSLVAECSLFCNRSEFDAWLDNTKDLRIDANCFSA